MGETLEFPFPYTLTNNGIITIYGTINNRSKIINNRTIQNYGTIINNINGIITNNNGTIENYGSIKNYNVEILNVSQNPVEQIPTPTPTPAPNNQITPTSTPSAPVPTPAPRTAVWGSMFTNNAQVYYKSHTVSSGGGTVRNNRHTSRRT
jgi:hypothetical protein